MWEWETNFHKNYLLQALNPTFEVLDVAKVSYTMC